MKYFFAPQWKDAFLKQGLANFEALWGLDLVSLDTPNRGRSRDGWSSVCAMNLELDNGILKKLIIKRQQNHNSRTIFHPFTGIPTFEKEMISILRYNRQNIPVMKPVYFARRKKNGVQAILITEFLDGFVSLDNLVKKWKQKECSHNTRKNLIKIVAKCISRMHAKGLMHNSMYPKHIFIKRNGDDFLIRLIDLEKSKQGLLALNRRCRDLESLYRHAKGWSAADHIRFIYAYFDTDSLDGRAKKLCKRIIKKTRKK
jgi:tRNA A-37 threonylcarbamoyl transferase component Bud32